MEQWQKEGLDKLKRSGYVDSLVSLARSFVVPFWWQTPNGPIGTSIKHNGTLCFINTGKNTIGVTASHVYDEYHKNKAADPTITCQLGSTTWIPDEYLIANDKDLDLSTFKIPESLVTASGGQFHHLREWPPETLKERELVLLGGFPGNLRVEQEQHTEFAFTFFFTRVTQNSDDHSGFQLNIQNSHWATEEKLNAEPDLGGISGGPIFRVCETATSASLKIVGFIYEANQVYELIFARHALKIDATGEIITN